MQTAVVTRGSLTGVIYEEEAASSADVLNAWAELSKRCDRPLAQPLWLLAWWAHCRPPTAQLRVVLVFDAGALIGVGPFYTVVAQGLLTCRLLADEASIGVEPLALPGRQAEVAEMLATVLAEDHSEIDVVRLDGVRVESGWPGLLVQHWSNSVVTLRHKTVGAPVATLANSYDAWLGQRSKNFRQQIRRFRRRMESEGAQFRVATAEEAPGVLEAFGRLHLERWAGRGGSTALVPGTLPMLTAAVPSLIAGGGARLHYVDVDGEIVAAALFLCAGREISYWLGGFDERHARNSPSILLLAEAVRSSLALGQDRLDLGAGEQEYKQRFADDRSDLEWVRVVTATGPRRLLARSLLRVTEAAYTMARRLPPGVQAILARSRNWTRSRVAGYRGKD